MRNVAGLHWYRETLPSQPAPSTPLPCSAGGTLRGGRHLAVSAMQLHDWIGRVTSVQLSTRRSVALGQDAIYGKVRNTSALRPCRGAHKAEGTLASYHSKLVQGHFAQVWDHKMIQGDVWLSRGNVMAV